MVPLPVKVEEHDPEEDGVADDGVGEEGLEAAVHYQRDAGVDERHAELDLGGREKRSSKLNSKTFYKKKN